MVSFHPVSPLRPDTPPLPTHMCNMPSPSHSSRFYHPHNIGWGVQIIELNVMQPPPFPRYLVPPRSKYSPQYHVLKHPQLSFLPQCQRPSFTPIQNNRQNLLLCSKHNNLLRNIMLTAMCLDSNESSSDHPKELIQDKSHIRAHFAIPNAYNEQ